MAGKVMSVGDDPQLLSLHHAVLERAGYHVITETNAHLASQKIASAPCDVLLLCYSMEIDVRQRLARQFREHCPDGRIITITNQYQAKPPVDADAFLYGLEGAESLLEIVRQQMDARHQ